jgi:hypothetical protein
MQVGSVVVYVLSDLDVELIGQQRNPAIDPQALRGQTVPMEITRVWGSTRDAEDLVDGKVILGFGIHTVNYVKRGNGPGTWSA